MSIYFKKNWGVQRVRRLFDIPKRVQNLCYEGVLILTLLALFSTCLSYAELFAAGWISGHCESADQQHNGLHFLQGYEMFM